MGILYHPVVFVCLGIIAGLAVGFYLRKHFVEGQHSNIRAQSKQIIENAIIEAEQLKKEALLQSKEEAYLVKQALEKELKAERDELKDEMRQLNKKRETLKSEWDSYDAKYAELLAGEKKLRQKETEIETKHKEVDHLLGKQRYEMARIAGISQEDAKKMLMESLESEARMDAAKRLARIENEMKMEADRKGKNILALAISRYAGDYVADKTVSMVPLPNDEMKGRIIGREGRNIRAIEAATGIDIIIDDTPEAVILSGFNPVRREIARLAQVEVSGGALSLVGRNPDEMGMALRGKSETPLDPQTGVRVQSRPRETIGARTLAGYAIHPPYQGGKGFGAAGSGRSGHSGI